MGTPPDPATERWLTELVALAVAQVPAEHVSLFGDFLRHYFAASPPDALSLRDSQALVDAAWSHYQLAAVRSPGALGLQFVSKAPYLGPGLSAIDSVIDDMPFLVDSIAMAIREAGSSIDWSVHPIIAVQRDPQGCLSAVDSNAQAPAEWVRESLIHVEFESLPDAQAEQQLQQSLHACLDDLRTVVDDFPRMRARLRSLIVELSAPEPKLVPGVDPAELEEAQRFLEWLDDGNFTFLGIAETQAVRAQGGGVRFCKLDPASLGLARTGARFADPDQLIAPAAELDKYTESTRVIVITKANHRSTIHHPEYIDVVSVRRFHADGSVRGICRFMGLFASEAYTERPRHIPLVRRKVAEVLRRSGLAFDSHSGKNLRGIMHQLPRDELFQSSEDELYQMCTAIRALRDRHQLRLLMRRDRYGRFYSCMVYLPRDRYTREIRDRIEDELIDVFGATGVDRNTEFLRHGLARIHYIVRTPPGTTVALDAAAIEARLLGSIRSWRDQLRDLLTHRGIDDAAQRSWVDAFPLSYREACPVAEAAEDLACLIRLDAACTLLPRLIVDPHVDGKTCPSRLKLYSWQKPVPLSDVLPMLENFGLRVIWQDPTELRKPDGTSVWIQAFEIEHAGHCPLAPADQRVYFESAFTATWQGLVENDGHHRLVLGAGLDVRRVVILRMLSKYLLQTALPFSQDFLERQLAAYADISRTLVDLFVARFDPTLDEETRQRTESAASQTLDERLEQVATLDADRVLRAYAGVVRAALRTNYFQRAADGHDKPYVSVKLDSSRVPELPAPRPMVEVFVYSPDVEGIHLRGGRVARGGLRWSDRRQDFRTEVLGLMKAQMVKNSIIVPVGAKGGFVVKRGAPQDRDAWLAQGVACYRTFLRGLLDITDNRVGDGVIAPPAVVRHDADDPYLVVAADKGTASFSDIANALAEEYGFWLGDAFASGGSAGYDHKKMGITARGAWESVKRHFLELSWTDDAGGRHQGRDIQHEPFTVVGIGDMSGDVFGNGMLLSPQIRLLAAFDHRHIFIDPDPDPAVSFAERQRLFALPRSSWVDYRVEALSAGGGIYPRTSKLIEISPQAQRALGLDRARFAPPELISALLRAPVDLLWNGGIGTYVKSRFEAHGDCGDRANDALRVNGAELRCKVIGEGGNLGLTQLGRVEAALAGVRLNTDFIDNAGGVHCSDREVNIKIVLNRLLAEGALARTARDALLADMTDDIARKVLRENTVQSLAVSLLQVNAAERLDEHVNLMRAIERDGQLSRTVEFLPDDEQLKQRRTQGTGLTRPELSLLLSHTKLALFNAVLDSLLPDDPFFDRDLLDYFPHPMVAAHADAIRGHRLRREIVATILANAVVNRMGIAFVHRHAEDHGVGRADVVKAYAMAHEIFAADRYWLAIQALDGQIEADAQLHLFKRAIGLMKHVTTWLLHRQWTMHTVGEAVAAFRDDIAQITAWMPELLPVDYRADWDRAADAMRGTGAPAELADALANTLALGSAPDIVELARAHRVPLRLAADVYFELGQQLPLLWLLGAVVGLRARSKWHALARSTLRADVYRIHRGLAAAVLDQPGENAAARYLAWSQAHEKRLAFTRQQLGELQMLDGHDFMTLAVAVRELGELQQAG